MNFNIPIKEQSSDSVKLTHNMTLQQFHIILAGKWRWLDKCLDTGDAFVYSMQWKLPLGVLYGLKDKREKHIKEGDETSKRNEHAITHQYSNNFDSTSSDVQHVDRNYKWSFSSIEM